MLLCVFHYDFLPIVIVIVIQKTNEMKKKKTKLKEVQICKPTANNKQLKKKLYQNYTIYSRKEFVGFTNHESIFFKMELNSIFLFRGVCMLL